ncbi:MAG: hypothetical protein QM778_04985 [Myxococcales bacterium]
MAPGLRAEVIGSPDDPQGVHFVLWRDLERLTERRFAPGPTDCAQLHAVVALAIAIALRTTLLHDLAVIPPPLPPAVPAPAHPRVAIGVDALLGSGLAPGLGAGLSAHASYAPRRWFGARFGGLASFGHHGQISGTSGGYSADLVASLLELCFQGRGAAWLEVATCTGPALGALFTEGEGFTTNSSASMLWARWLANAEVVLRIGPRLGIALGVLMGVPLMAPRAVVRDQRGGIAHHSRVDGLGSAVTAGLRVDL